MILSAEKDRENPNDLSAIIDIDIEVEDGALLGDVAQTLFDIGPDRALVWDLSPPLHRGAVNRAVTFIAVFLPAGWPDRGKASSS